MTASDARALANSLTAFDDETLGRMLAERGVAPTVTWGDFFDAADGLLEPASVARALRRLTAREAAALDAAITGRRPVAEDLRAALRGHGLVADDGTVFAAVHEAWAVREEPAPTPPLPGEPTDDDEAAERAFDAVASLADILHLTLTTPLARIGTGALSAGERRRLVDAGAAASADDVDALVELAARAGLLAPLDRSWRVTPDGEQWLRTGTLERWHAVARRLRAALPEPVRSHPASPGADHGWIPVADWAGAVPLDPEWPPFVAQLAGLLHRWAMLGGDGEAPGWARAMPGGGDADLSALQALLPGEVDKIFLQNDLTAIAPGPLEPHIDARLRTMARRESRAQASSYRFTPESLNAALTGDETRDSLHAFLAQISLTGVPQALGYEIDRAAARHGRIRVGSDAGGLTRVRTDDEALLAMIDVDQALRPLGLVRDRGALVTRTAPDTVFWMLADARYPVIAVDADDVPRRPDRAGAAPTTAETPVNAYAPLLERMRAALDTDADAAWLERELEQAVRAKATLSITVQMPDGSEREVRLEATGLGGGRLRGRDAAADVERTLPVRSILRVAPA